MAGKMDVSANLELVGLQLQNARASEDTIGKSELEREVVRLTGCSPDSVLPSDHCYNLHNGGIAMNIRRYFLHVGTQKSGLYRFLGVNAKYTGPMHHYPKGTSAKVLVGYWHDGELVVSQNLDVDDHDYEAGEGRRKLTIHLRIERNQAIVRKKKAAAKSLNCEVCGFSFAKIYGEMASTYCEVHHKVPLALVDENARTRLSDLSIVCSNCHRVIHLTNPPRSVLELREKLGY